MRTKKGVTLLLAVLLMMMSSRVDAADATGQYLDDATLTAKVKAALVADSYVHATDITVTTDKGVVRLTGNVDTQQQFAMAAKDANGVSGVHSVSNLLAVRQAAE